MKTARSILLALLTGACLLAPAASQAETIFERFAPPLPPLPQIVIRSGPVYDDYHEERRVHRAPPRHYHYHYEREVRHPRHRHPHHDRYRRDDRHDHDRYWR